MKFRLILFKTRLYVDWYKDFLYDCKFETSIAERNYVNSEVWKETVKSTESII